MRSIPERDWKVLRDVSASALERFCEATLADVGRLIATRGVSAHERYGSVYGLVKARDKELARAFDGLTRSMAYLHIVAIRSRGLMKPEEFARFSDETRAAIEAFDVG